MTRSKLSPENVQTVIEWIGWEICLASDIPDDEFLSDVKQFVLSHPDVTAKLVRAFEKAVREGVPE